jgi:hypothetical protein
MSFFQNFPKSFFTLSRDQKKIVTDIFRRVLFAVPDNTAVLLPYVVQDGETPELVSNKLYGSPFYHWTLLIINNIVDVRTEWPLENKFVTAVVYDKYNFTVFFLDTSAFTVGQILTTDIGGELEVTNVEEFFIELRSKQGKTYIEQNTIFTLPDLSTVGGVISVIDPEEATHHYIDTRFNLEVDFDEFNPFIESVSNIDHEIAVNEKKRLVRVIDPQQISTTANALQRAYVNE